MSQDKLDFPHNLGHQVANQPSWDPPNGPSHEWSGGRYKLSWGNTIVPGSPLKKMPIRLTVGNKTFPMSELFVLCERHAKNGHGNLLLCQIQDTMSEYLIIFMILG